MSIIFPITTWLIGLFILYFVISTAVKHGINKSVVGQYLEKKSWEQNDRK